MIGRPSAGGAARRIEDRYLDGTHLRLRQVTGEDGTSVFKLTQKVRQVPSDPTSVHLTNLYLSEAEHAVLCRLPCAVLLKTRTVHELDGAPMVVDAFGGHLAGLRLAEVEVDDLDAALPTAVWLGPEVTRDERCTGGALARATPSEVVVLLDQQAGALRARP